MASGVDIFTKERFEQTLNDIGFDFKSLGLVKGQEEYLIDFGNPDCFIRLCSSIAPDGKSRECGEDSIRAWLVDPQGNPLGKTKIGHHTTRRPKWEQRLAMLLPQLARLGRWIQPCPKCQKLLLLAVKKDKVYLFCPTDSQNRETKDYERHVSIMTLDKLTGEQIQQQPSAPPADHGLCPTCGTKLVQVTIGKGKQKGKKAITCPKKDDSGKFLNHVFEVQA